MTRSPPARQPAVLALAFALAMLWLVPGFARADGASPLPAEIPPDAPCLERPVVVVYLHHLEDRVLDLWTIPEDTLADQVVVVRFRLAEDGSFLTYKLVSSTSQRIANAVGLAVEHAAPFGPIPETATCLVGREFDLRFENPY